MNRSGPITIPTEKELEALFQSGLMAYLGMGSRRCCYRIPDTNLCVKAYRTQYGREQVDKPAIRLEIERNRFSERRNASCAEWAYYQELKKRLPQSLLDVFPCVLEHVCLPSRGWCLVEELIANADGSPSVSVEDEFRRRSWREGKFFLEEAMRKIRELGDELARHAVRFYDPPNILAQFAEDGEFRLRIADFEPVPRTFISLDALGSFFVSLKVRRRFARYLKRLAEWVPQC